jgi:hypothetical protein
MWSPCFLISSAERDEYDHPALRPFATIARSYIAIKNQKQNAGLLCGNWRTIEMIGFTVNDRELFFAQKLGTSPPLNMRSATACALIIQLHLMVDLFVQLQHFLPIRFGLLAKHDCSDNMRQRGVPVLSFILQSLPQALCMPGHGEKLRKGTFPYGQRPDHCRPTD